MVEGEVHPAAGDVEDALDSLDRAEDELRRRQKAASEVVRQACRIEDKNERLRLVRQLYWLEERIRVPDLVVALFGEWDERNGRVVGNINALSVRFAHRLRKLVGPGAWVDCSTPGCTRKAPITSRTLLKQVQHYYRPTLYCEDCQLCPQRPVPGPNWREVVPSSDELRQRWEESQRRYEQVRRQKRQELNALKEELQLSPDKLARLYELLSWDEDYGGDFV